MSECDARNEAVPLTSLPKATAYVAGTDTNTIVKKKNNLLLATESAFSLGHSWRLNAEVVNAAT